jgi:hypothetical protein
MRLTLGQQHRLQRLDVIGKWCLALLPITRTEARVGVDKLVAAEARRFLAREQG